MADLSFSDRAYVKIVLHAAKYPHCSVNGVLIAEDSKKKDAKSVHIVDAVPFFHQSLTLAPMLEVALTQVDSYCKSMGLVIAGYYQANEHLTDAKPNLVAYKVAERVYSYYSDAILVMVDNLKMDIECEENVCRIYQNVDGKWSLKEHRDCVQKETLAAASSLLNSKAFRDLVDFDSHLDDIQQDWKNLELNELLEHAS